jgi:hypothetical protein
VRLLRGRTDFAELKRDLTAKHFDPQTGVTTPVRMYRETEHYFSMPRHYGREHFPDLWERALDRTAKPLVVPKTYDRHIEPRDEKQAAFIKQIRDAMQEAIDNVIIDVQVNAQTGTGKTVAAMAASSDLQISPILVVVHQNRLKEQWRGSIEQKKGYKFFFGESFVDQKVGIVQQNEFDVQGRAVVIAMGPTLISRRFPQWFYDYFGVVLIDELHKFAAPMLSNCLDMFSASCRIGMTATEKKGNMRSVARAHLGPPAIVSTQMAMKPTVVRIRNRMQNEWGKEWDTPNGCKMQLARSKQRNDLLARIIYERGYLNDRHCLGIGDRVNQILQIRKRLVSLGVPSSTIGVYVGAYKTGKYKAYAQLKCGLDDSITKRMSRSPVFDKKADAEQFAYDWTLRGDIQDAWGELEKAGAQPYFDVGSKFDMAKPSAEEYDYMENHCQIILATYGIFDVAIDVARLDWGIELTPRPDVEQPVGRVLRIKDGKKTPAWYTIEDYIVTFDTQELFGKSVIQQYIYQTPKRLAEKRLASYIRQNATFRKISNPYAALGHP